MVLRDGTQPDPAVPAGPWAVLSDGAVHGSYTDDPAGCRVFEPGHYLRPPDFGGLDAYFKSGNYYLDFMDPLSTLSTTPVFADLVAAAFADAELDVTTRVSAGRATSVSPVHANPDCASAISADTSGGASFYLAGKAHLRVSSGAFEIMPRTQPGVGRISVQALCDPDASGPQGVWCEGASAGVDPPNPSTLDTNTETLIFSAGDLVAHGLVYAPRAEVKSGASSSQRFRNGFVVSRVELGSDTRVSRPVASGTVAVTVTSTATAGGATTRVRAIVDFEQNDDPAARVRIDTWRVCEPAGC
jgi:hypothetical protein